MRDSDDKWRLLKRERASRSRAESIQRSWRKIEDTPDLTTKEKLERLITLTGKPKREKRAAELPQPGKRKPFELFENHYHLHTRYGKIPLDAGLGISGDSLALLGRDRAFAEHGLSSALFLDLETTGLSGGVGVVPFLVGLGYYRDAQFHVSQFFLGDLAEEGRLITEVGRFLSDMGFRSLVTFNGKGFDLPLLETRFILHRQPLPLSGLPHLDFLFSARSLWSHKQESCRLYNLAQQILEADREEDIPSSEIPSRYFEYLRTGDFALIDPILYHNQEDLLSLLGIVITGAGFLEENPDADAETRADAMDLFGAAKVLEKTGEVDRSAAFIRKALEGALSAEVEVLARMKLASYFKKNREWEKAVALWQEVAPLQQLASFRELAMYYEHKAKDYERALALAEEGLGLASGISKKMEKEFCHRLERLRRKACQSKRGGAQP